MAIVNLLTDAGAEKFGQYIDMLREDPSLTPPRELLSSELMSEHLDISVDIDERIFDSKYELALYLSERLRVILPLEKDYRLWNWLALFYFDVLCPLNNDGQRTPKSNYFYILNPTGHYGDSYRHLIAGPSQIFLLDPLVAEALLTAKPNIHPEEIDQFLGTQRWPTVPGYRQTFFSLYYKKKADGKWMRKRGASSKTRPGNVRRFGKYMHQIDPNFDIYSLSRERLLAILPSEFKAFIET